MIGSLNSNCRCPVLFINLLEQMLMITHNINTEHRRTEGTKQTQPQLTQRTVTHCSGIFAMNAIMNSNTTMAAVSQACLPPSAGHVVKVDWTSASTEEGSSRCRSGSSVTKLTAHHIGIVNAPTVITHSAPFSIVVDFYPSLVGSGTSHQSDVTLWCMRETTTVKT